MKKYLERFYEKAPANYPPKALEDVDFEFDERHTWRRAMRQNRHLIKLYLAVLTMIWAAACFYNSTYFYVFSLTTTVFFILIFLREKRDDEALGHLKPGPEGDYWRARLARSPELISHTKSRQ